MTDHTIVKSVALPTLRGKYLDAAISLKIEPGANLVTDSYRTFRLLSLNGKRKPRARYVPKIFGGRDSPFDLIAAFRSTLRHGLKNQHASVEERNLWKYIAEYEFRLNRRTRSGEIFDDMVKSFPRLDEAHLQRLNVIEA